jgi:hypothetical protein
MIRVGGKAMFDKRYMAGAFGALPALGFAIPVTERQPTEKPVMFGHVSDPQAHLWKYFATIDCVREGHSLEGYVHDRDHISTPVNIFDLKEGISVITLSRALLLRSKDLMSIDADPLCVQAGGFERHKTSLLLSLLR